MVGAAEALTPLPQAPVAMRGREAQAVALLPRKVPLNGVGEDDQFTASTSPTAVVLQAGCIVQT